ncbi:MAG: 4'-phosphopantetheinyl transferase superfamily protein [Balneolaceae bacterium]
MTNRTLEEIFDPEVLSNKAGRLEEGDVHLWVINRIACREQNNYSEYFLSEAEQNRAQRFRFSRDRDLFVLGRHITRILLAHYAGSDPDKVKIVPDASGKPSSDLRLNFNISHSHDQLLLGFSNSAIGVDIEKIDSSVDIKSLGESHFSEIEFQIMMNDTKNKRCDRFFEIWTKKESLVKGIGKGLRISLQDFNVTGWNGKVRWGLPTGQMVEGWHVRELEAKPGYKSAFATRNATVNLSHFRLKN